MIFTTARTRRSLITSLFILLLATATVQAGEVSLDSLTFEHGVLKLNSSGSLPPPHWEFWPSSMGSESTGMIVLDLPGVATSSALETSVNNLLAKSPNVKRLVITPLSDGALRIVFEVSRRPDESFVPYLNQLDSTALELHLEGNYRAGKKAPKSQAKAPAKDKGVFVGVSPSIPENQDVLEMKAKLAKLEKMVQEKNNQLEEQERTAASIKRELEKAQKELEKKQKQLAHSDKKPTLEATSPSVIPVPEVKPALATTFPTKVEEPLPQSKTWQPQISPQATPQQSTEPASYITFNPQPEKTALVPAAKPVEKKATVEKKVAATPAVKPATPVKPAAKPAAQAAKKETALPTATLLDQVTGGVNHAVKLKKPEEKIAQGEATKIVVIPTNEKEYGPFSPPRFQTIKQDIAKQDKAIKKPEPPKQELASTSGIKPALKITFQSQDKPKVKPADPAPPTKINKPEPAKETVVLSKNPAAPSSFIAAAAPEKLPKPTPAKEEPQILLATAAPPTVPVKKELPKTKNELIKLINTQPVQYEAYIALGKLYAAEKKYQDAERVINNILLVNPNFADAYFSMAEIYLEQNRSLEAHVALENYKRLAPQETARIQTLQKQVQEALLKKVTTP